MHDAWTETGHLPEGVVLSFDAIDADAADAVELRTFLREVHEPSEEQRSSGPFAGSRPGPSGAVATASILAAASLLFLPGLAGALCAVASLGGVAGFGVARRAWENRKNAALTAPRPHTARVSVDAIEVFREGKSIARVPLYEVRQLVGGPRLEVHLRDGTVQKVGVRVPTDARAPLAARLTELVVEGLAKGRAYR